MNIEGRTLAGVILVIVALFYYFFSMRRQLRRLRQGYLPGTRFGHLHGYGALLYNLLETANIAAAAFFALHIGYILTRDYGLMNIRYGLYGIGMGFATVFIARFLLLLLRVGPSYCSRLIAAGWVSLLSGLLAFGIWSIVTTEGKVLEMRVPEETLNLVITALIPVVTFVVWMTLSYSQTE